MFNVKHIHRESGIKAVIEKAEKIEDKTYFHIMTTLDSGLKYPLIFPEQEFYDTFRFYCFLTPEELQEKEQVESIKEDVNEGIMQLINIGYKFKSFSAETIDGQMVDFDLKTAN